MRHYPHFLFFNYRRNSEIFLRIYSILHARVQSFMDCDGEMNFSEEFVEGIGKIFFRDF